MREKIANAPLPIYGAVMAVIFGGLTLLFGAIFQYEHFSIITVVGHLIGGIFFGVTMSIFIGYQRRRSGGFQQSVALRKALKSGTVPEGASAEDWGQSIHHLRRMSRFNRWLGPVVFGLVAALGVFLAITEDTMKILWVVYAAVFLALAIASPISAQRTLRKLDAVEAQLTHAPESRTAIS